MARVGRRPAFKGGVRSNLRPMGYNPPPPPPGAVRMSVAPPPKPVEISNAEKLESIVESLEDKIQAQHERIELLEEELTEIAGDRDILHSRLKEVEEHLFQLGESARELRKDGAPIFRSSVQEIEDMLVEVGNLHASE